ncbi:MAG TPA: hypothetical protein VFK41_01090 [Nocardioidaceae bacterium]|nr:hypothetical protein [Nocardioidaceae bacterium]
MIAAVLCPHPPLLFRELTGRQDVAAELRAACHDVLSEALATAPTRVVVVGAADEAREWTGEPAVRRFGTNEERRETDELPLSLGVGRRLLDEAGWSGETELVSLTWDAGDEVVDALGALLRQSTNTVALVLGEGSTRRGDKAPGFLDERSFPFDSATAAALESGDATALRGLDVVLADELMVLGRTAFRVLGALGRPLSARLAYDHDPFGVAYHVALWRYT